MPNLQMQQARQEIADLSQLIAAAIEQKDWQRANVISQQRQQRLEHFFDTDFEAEQKRQILDWIQELLAFEKQLQLSAGQGQQQLSAQHQQLKQGRKLAKHYLSK